VVRHRLAQRVVDVARRGLAGRTPGYGGRMRGPLPTAFALVCGLLAALAGCGGGSGSPDGSVEVTVTPVRYECVRDVTSQTSRTCTPLSGVASVSCSPDEIAYSLPEGVSEPDVNAGEVCERLDDDDLLSPEVGASCARPLGRVTVVGELDGDPVRLGLRSCPGGGGSAGDEDDEVDADDVASEWARLVGLPFAKLPGS
jgi:hypothetical protein